MVGERNRNMAVYLRECAQCGLPIPPHEDFCDDDCQLEYIRTAQEIVDMMLEDIEEAKESMTRRGTARGFTTQI